MVIELHNVLFIKQYNYPPYHGHPKNFFNYKLANQEAQISLTDTAFLQTLKPIAKMCRNVFVSQVVIFAA